MQELLVGSWGPQIAAYGGLVVAYSLQYPWRVFAAGLVGILAADYAHIVRPAPLQLAPVILAIKRSERFRLRVHGKLWVILYLVEGQSRVLPDQFRTILQENIDTVDRCLIVCT